MRRLKMVVLALVLGCLVNAQAFTYIQPSKDFPEVFDAVQMARLFPDSKRFPDAIPNKSPEAIRAAFKIMLERFVHENFEMPVTSSSGFASDATILVEEHLNRLWLVLTRQPDVDRGGSLIPLPKPYVVPGGRFREIYYWDSYFTMLGLQVSGKTTMIRNMVDNFAYLVDEVGHIPNGNRSYFVSRSQPPYLAAMVSLLAEEEGDDVLARYLPQLEKEYWFWMDGGKYLARDQRAYRRVVLMPNGSVLNRYWDDNPAPRPEAYLEDVETAIQSGRLPQVVYRNLRAAAESGWDFSSRWLADGKSLATIETTRIVPICLNTLLYNLEETLAKAYEFKGDNAMHHHYVELADARREAMQTYFWDENSGVFQDYNFIEAQHTGRLSLAMTYPLFFELATPEHAKLVAATIERDFLKLGGVITTPMITGQQWDAPNGWAPLHWLTVKGLRNYQQNQLADAIADRWITINTKIYSETGKMMEKYNVIDTSLEAGGGEYPSQDGFGWSNGVLLRLLHDQRTRK